MEFLSGLGEPALLNPLELPTHEQLERTQTALCFFIANAGHIRHLKQKAEEVGRTGEDSVVTLIDVDDPVGSKLADTLVPGHDWQRYRNVSETPVMRSVATKDGVLDFLGNAGHELATRELSASDDLMVVVLNSGVALVLDASFSE